jgi:hypothetical protein
LIVTEPGERWPEVRGPVEAPNPPWGHPGPSAAEAGYTVEEFKLDGLTVAYEPEPDSTLGSDGRWQTGVAGEAGYRTRLLVVRPRDPAQFNGTVLLNWQNVSAGVESHAPRGGEVYRGYAWVGVSAQEVGLYGFPMGMTSPSGVPRARPLVEHDPERYRDLRHPGDQGSFEIFSQAARAVGPDRRTAVDPLAGLDVRRVVATGGSQSAMRLVAYINAVHPVAGVVDGYVLSLWEGRAPHTQDGAISFGGLRTTIRSDVEVPVLVVNSEFEALGVHAVGTSDTDSIRVWEVTGTPHAPSRPRRAADAASGWTANSLTITPVHESALRHVHRWLTDGTPAPQQPRIRMTSGPPATIERDLRGNARGGIRLPELEAPVAEHRGLSFGTGRAPLFGASRRFGDDVLRDLYPTRQVFEQRWCQAVDNLLHAGAILPEDVAAMEAAAKDVRLPVS